MKNLRRYWAMAFWTCAVIVLVLSLAPDNAVLTGTGWDKSNHALAFGVLAVLGSQAYPMHGIGLPAGLLGYGGMIEILQSFTPYHLGEWGDVLADLVGIVAGLAFVLLWRAILGARKSM